MSETAFPPRHVLHLVIEGFPTDKLAEISAPSPAPTEVTREIFHLTEANAREALRKIFAADTIAVWGRI